MIPDDLLLPGLRSDAPAGSSAGSYARAPTAVPEIVRLRAGRRRRTAPRTCPYRLEYGEDGRGSTPSTGWRPARRSTRASWCASSARVLAPDVNALAAEVARAQRHRRRHRHPRRPPGEDPVRAAAAGVPAAGEPAAPGVRGLAARERPFTNRVRTADLSGVTVILDAGHGGEDPGAILRRRLGEPLRLRRQAAGQAASCESPHGGPRWSSPPATATTSRSRTATCCRSPAATRCSPIRPIRSRTARSA